MKAIASKSAERGREDSAGPRVQPVAATFLDPLDADCSSDQPVLTTRRGIARVALVATAVASHLKSAGIDQEPMAWMLSPRSLFGGAAAIDACLRRADCVRGVLLHTLALGVDADPQFVDALIADDVDGAAELLEAASPTARAASEGRARRDNVIAFRPPSSDRLRLFTATVVANDGFETVQAFHASLAADEAEVSGRLYCRIGAAAADARIVEGFDPTDALVGALVSEVMCDTLAIIAAQPSSPIAAGLDVNIEQRFFA